MANGNERVASSLIAFVVGFLGCATPVWVNRSGRPADFAIDRYQCEMETQTIVDGESVTISGPITRTKARTRTKVDEELFEHCLEARGWRLSDLETERALQDKAALSVTPFMPPPSEAVEVEDWGPYRNDAGPR
jgi:hypothetical protein